MTTQTQVGIPGDQHFVINRTMHFMAARTAVARGFMFPHERSLLFLMAFEAGFIGIIHAGGTPGLNFFAMRAVAVRTAHLTLENRMTVRQIKVRALLCMAGETNARIFFRINDAAFASVSIRVDTARSVTHFTPLGRALIGVIGNTRVGG